MAKKKINFLSLEVLAGEAVGEWQEHIQKFITQPGYKLEWFDDKSRVLPLITNPLRRAWQEDWNEQDRHEIKLALQYTLNHDEHIIPRLRENGSVADDVFASAQDIGYRPEDSYLLCLWMWEALFPNEDWHTDISGWEVEKYP